MFLFSPALSPFDYVYMVSLTRHNCLAAHSIVPVPVGVRPTPSPARDVALVNFEKQGTTASINVHRANCIFKQKDIKAQELNDLCLMTCDLWLIAVAMRRYF